MLLDRHVSVFQLHKGVIICFTIILLSVTKLSFQNVEQQRTDVNLQRKNSYLKIAYYL